MTLVLGAKSENPLSPDYIPSIFEHTSTAEKKRRNMLLDTFSRRQRTKRQRRAQAEKSSAALVHLPVTSPTESPQESEQPSADLSSTECPVGESENADLEENSPLPATVAASDGPTCNSDICKQQVRALEFQCQALRTENMLLKEIISKTELNETALENNDKKVNLLTGLSAYSLLIALFQVVAPFLKHRSNLSLFQQYMLTLMKLRMNFSFDFLSFYFGVDSTTISKLFKHCINVMHERLYPNIVTWPEREPLRESLPYAFRNSVFEKTVCIIDCFEIFMEKPSNLLASAQCYSTYKSHHTMKYLIAITPQGSICFISNGWGGPHKRQIHHRAQ